MDNILTSKIIGAAIEVHKELGPGLLESAYEECLCHELGLQRIAFKRQLPVPVSYKGVRLDCGYRLDLLVEDSIVVELKACDGIAHIHRAQLLTYLKLMDKPLGLILNFQVSVLRDGIARIANEYGKS
jgi:GxxExxY protein